MMITERDEILVREIARWRFALGRQLKIIGEFGTNVSLYRRLKKLEGEGYIEKKHVLYGVPALYTVKRKGLEFFCIDLGEPNINLSNIYHDIAVLDTALYLMKTEGLDLLDIKTERELRRGSGINPAKHVVDFIYRQDDKKMCCEVEMSLKSKARLERNSKENYRNFDGQLWVIPKNREKIKDNLNEVTRSMTDIRILELEEVQEYVKQLSGGSVSE